MFVTPIERNSDPLTPLDTNTPSSPPSQIPKSPVGTLQAENVPPQLAPACTAPVVLLDADSIATDMAACLACSLLGHVLFLKSQIPFPVIQLSRMPNAKTDSRIVKKRVELLAAMDTLASHLNTTFSALSHAYAHPCKTDITRHSTANESASLARAHMAFVVGPSVGAAKARVLLVVDGLEVRSHDLPADPAAVEESGAESIVLQQGEDVAELASTDHEDETDTDSDNESDATEPPPSRTPSPSPPPSSPPSPIPSVRPSSEETRLPFTSESRQALASLAFQRSTPKSMPPPSRTYAEGQQILRTAERLLSRTLTSACAEDDGGLSAELAPAQTHIFLRAPRRFTHPAWIPRQNHSRSLDGALENFMSDTISQPECDSPIKKARRLGIKTEGVWVSCKSKIINIPHADPTPPLSVNEEDEQIWWEWNGKIEGFSGW